MIKKCRGNDVAAFAKLSHLTYVRTATDGNMLVVALNLQPAAVDFVPEVDQISLRKFRDLILT